MSLLEVEDLAVDVAPGVRAVHGVSFVLERGEALGLVGASGSGKTVTAKALLGLFPARGRITGGRIRLDGEALQDAPARRWRAIRGAKVAMVFQDPMTALNPVLKIGSQIGEAIGQHERVSRPERRRRTIELLAKVHLASPEHVASSYPHQLSGGMRQRALIAMALALRPAVLIADEATTALDVTVQAEILDLFAEIREKEGTAILLITHDLAVVARVCERVLVMYGGTIVEAGTVREILERPRHEHTCALLDALPMGRKR